MSQYGQRRKNSACGCFHIIGADNGAGICGSLWPTCSQLVIVILDVIYFLFVIRYR
ncbi:hypothetical protein I4U23_000241 [Adineta vaga]|nr:hypothetical protein I4U23_000241 [Adineta vaga]